MFDHVIHADILFRRGYERFLSFARAYLSAPIEPTGTMLGPLVRTPGHELVLLNLWNGKSVLQAVLEVGFDAVTKKIPVVIVDV